MMELGRALGTQAELAVVLKLKNEMKGPLAEASAELAAFNRQGTTVGGALGKIGSGLAAGARVAATATAVLGTAAAVVGVKATNAAKTFQADMEMIRTQAHASQGEVDSMTKSVIAMSGEVGTGPDELSAGLYHLESAGFRGAKALDALRIAAEGAKVGHADLEDVTNALDAVLVAGGKDADNLGGSMGELNAIVGAGDMRMQDLADAMGTGILGVAHTFGLTLKDVGAALATFGDNNIRGSDAATKLRQAIVMMGAPSASAAKALGEVGLKSTALADTMRNQGLVPALELLETHLKDSGLTASQQADVIAKAFGGGRTGAGIMLLLDQLDRVKTKEEDVGKGADSFGADWQAQEQTVQQATDDMKASLESLEDTLGIALLPAARRVMKSLASFFSDPTTINGVRDLGDRIADLFSQDNINRAMQFVRQVIPKMGDFASSVIPPLVDGLKVASQIGKTAFDMFNSLPDDVKPIVIAALAGNKLTGGLVASGIADLGKIVVGAFKHAATANMNVAAGTVNVVGGPGIAGAAEGAAGAAAAGGGIGGLVAGAAGVGLIAVAALGVAKELQDTATFKGNVGDLRSQYGLTNPEAVAYQVYQQGGIGKLQGESRSGLVNSLLAQGTTYNAALAAALSKINGPGVAGGSLPMIGEHSALGPSLVSAVNAMQQLHGEHAGITAEEERANLSPVIKVLDQLHQDFLAQRAALQKATSPAEILAAAQGLTKDILGGVGNVSNTSQALSLLRAKEQTVTDPKTKAAIDKLISQVDSRLDTRKWVAGILSTDEKLLDKAALSSGDMSHIKNDIAQLRTRGDTHAASELAKLVDAARRQKTATDTTNRNITVVGQDIRLSKPPVVNVTVSTSVTVRDQQVKTQRFVRYGRPVPV